MFSPRRTAAGEKQNTNMIKNQPVSVREGGLMDFSLHANQAQVQKQKLLLTAQIKESLEILQMPLAELRKKIDIEITENPVLEYDESRKSEDGASADCEEKTEDEFFDDDDSCTLGIAKKILSDNYNYSAAGSNNRDRENYDPFAVISSEPDFSDYLQVQLLELKLDPITEKICRYIIWDLDERGFLNNTADEIAEDLGLENAIPVGNAINIIKHMEPAGVGASCLSECLTLQLQKHPDSDPALFVIANKYLELLANNKIAVIAQKLGVPAPKAQELCSQIRSMNPIPSSGFNTGTCEKFVIPEAEIIKDSSGKFIIKSNDEFTPRVYINPFYLHLAEHPDNKETEKYLKDKIKSASSMIFGMSIRKKTITRVLEKIVELQPLYFDKGTAFLQPMTMKTIAEQLEVNESTVSRAIQNKFILCGWGIISIKSLFTYSFNTAENGLIFSSASVKQKIKGLIESERKEAPLSDQAISLNLKESGILISRRTIAKYRNQLDIPSASHRKMIG